MPGGKRGPPPRLHCETGRLLNSCSYSSARVALEAGAWRSALGVCSSIDSFVRIESVSLLLRRQFSEFCFKGDTTIGTYPVNTTVWVSLAPVFRSTPRVSVCARRAPLRISKHGVSDDLEHLAAVEPSGGGGFVIADEAFRRGDAGAQRG